MIFLIRSIHRNKVVLKSIEDKTKAKKIIERLSNGKIDEGLEMITEIMIENKKDDKKDESVNNFVL